MKLFVTIVVSYNECDQLTFLWLFGTFIKDFFKSNYSRSYTYIMYTSIFKHHNIEVSAFGSDLTTLLKTRKVFL